MISYSFAFHTAFIVTTLFSPSLPYSAPASFSNESVVVYTLVLSEAFTHFSNVYPGIVNLEFGTCLTSEYLSVKSDIAPETVLFVGLPGSELVAGLNLIVYVCSFQFGVSIATLIILPSQVFIPLFMKIFGG